MYPYDYNNNLNRGESERGEPETSYYYYGKGPEMPNWNGGGPGKTTRPQNPRPKKKHTFAKVLASGLAVILLSFSFGYLGSAAAVRSAELDGTDRSSASSGPAAGGTQTPLVNTASGYDSTEATMIEQVVAATAGSVVEITTEQVVTDGYFQQKIASGAGSGVIISADGYIVTNHHVIDGASKITVTLRDGTQYPATLIGSDAKTDIAVLKVDASGLTPVVFGDSDALNVGEPAIVIGNPLGQLGGTVTNGIISALDRQITTTDGQVMTLLQTNAAVNPGNSGGALFNDKGELIGVVNAKSGGTEGGTTIEGLGFAIPVNIARPVIENLIQYGYVQGRIDLGMSLLDINDAMNAMLYRVNSLGVYVLDVESGSNAAKAGIRSGDRIVSVNGTGVSSESEINQILDGLQVGDQVELTLERSGRTGTVSFTLQEQKGDGIAI